VTEDSHVHHNCCTHNNTTTTHTTTNADGSKKRPASQEEEEDCEGEEGEGSCMTMKEFLTQMDRLEALATEHDQEVSQRLSHTEAGGLCEGAGAVGGVTCVG
jgi:hypothetical protein